MRDRKEEIIRLAEPVFAEQFLKSAQATVRSCGQHRREVVGSFLGAFYEALDHAHRSQDRQEKGRIRYLHFSHLYSSLFLERYLIRIDVWDERFYNDPSGEETYWDAGPIYRLFEDDIREIRRQLEWSVPRIRGYETDELRYAYAPFYHGLMKAFLGSMVDVLIESPALWKRGEAWADDARIAFGEYMGRADVLSVLSGGEGTDAIFLDPRR